MQQASIKQAFWDYNFTEQGLLKKLATGSKEEKTWIIGRIVENLPYDSIWKYITLKEFKEVFPKLHLRPKLKKIWDYSLDLWEKHDQDTH